MSKALEQYSRIPPRAKGIIAVAVTLAGIYGIYRGIKAYNAYKLAENEREANKAVGKEIKELDKAGLKPSLSDAQIKTMANSLFTAMNGCGTDEASVVSVLSNINNDIEMNQLVKAYGVRKHSCMWTGTNSYGLVSALRDELADIYIKKFNNDFKEKGMKFKI